MRMAAKHVSDPSAEVCLGLVLLAGVLQHQLLDQPGVRPVLVLLFFRQLLVWHMLGCIPVGLRVPLHPFGMDLRCRDVKARVRH